MSLTVSHGCWLSLTVSPVPLSYYMSITVSQGCLLLPQSHEVATYLSQFLMVASCLSLSLPVLWICCMSLTVFIGY